MRSYIQLNNVSGEEPVSIDVKMLTGLEILEEAGNLNKLADKAIEAGEYENAEKLAQTALCIKESELGANHLLVALDLFNVGLLCQALGNYAEAFALLRRALVIEQPSLGSDHPTVLETQRALSELLDEIDEFAYMESPIATELILKGA